jgi:hypothetical protein
MFINQLIRLSSEDDTEIIKAKDDEFVKSKFSTPPAGGD